MLVDREMKRRDFEYLNYGKVACCKWLDRGSVTMLFNNFEGIATISIVPRQQKKSASKIQVPCPDVFKTYNKGMCGVDLTDQRAAAYHLDQNVNYQISFAHFVFFDLIDFVCANSYIVYNMMHPNDLALLNFKTIVSTYLIGRYTSQSRAPPYGKTDSKRKYQYQFEQGNLPPHLTEFKIFGDELSIATKKELT